MTPEVADQIWQRCHNLSQGRDLLDDEEPEHKLGFLTGKLVMVWVDMPDKVTLVDYIEPHKVQWFFDAYGQ